MLINNICHVYDIATCMYMVYSGSIFFLLFRTVRYMYDKYKNEVGCRDDTMPNTGDTRRHCKVVQKKLVTSIKMK